MLLRGRFFDGYKEHAFAELSYEESNGTIEYLEDKSHKERTDQDITFLPGLIDTHIHFFGTGTHSLQDWVLTDVVTVAIRSVSDARALLHAGFTTVRTMGDKVSLSMSKAERLGYLESPRIISSGFSLAETGGDDDPRNLPIELARQVSYSYYCDGPWECRRAVRMNIRNGAESIKAYSSSSFAGNGKIKNEFTVEELTAIVDEAHASGLKAASHAYGEQAISNSLGAGFDSIEHGLTLTEDLASTMKKQGTFYVPTLSIYNDRRTSTNARREEMIRRHREKETRIAADAGVKIAVGTDFLGAEDNPHGQNYKEIVYLSEHIGTEAALRAGTSAAAECLGLDRTGKLEKGFQADIIAVSGNPLKDPTKLRPENVILVIKQGKIVRDKVGLTQQ